MSLHILGTSIDLGMRIFNSTYVEKKKKVTSIELDWEMVTRTWYHVRRIINIIWIISTKGTTVNCTRTSTFTCIIIKLLQLITNSFPYPPNLEVEYFPNWTVCILDYNPSGLQYYHRWENNIKQIAKSNKIKTCSTIMGWYNAAVKTLPE